MKYPPDQKPPIWAIDPGIIAYNCRKHGMPHPVLAMPIWEGAGNRVVDYSGHGNHGIITYADWIRSKNGVCLNFSGISDEIDCGDLNSFNNEITISGRIYPGAQPNFAKIVNKRNEAGTNYVYSLQYDDADHLKLVLNDNAVTATSGNTYVSAQWYHVIATYNGSDMTLYIDGSVDGTGNGVTTVPGSNKNMIIGKREVPTTQSYNGFIDNVIIFDTGLTPTQAKFLSNNPYFMYQIPEELYGYVSAVTPATIPVFMNHYKQMMRA